MEQEAQAPFVWVEIRNPQRSEISGWHDRFQGERITVRLDVEIKVVSEYLHIGSGMLRVDETGGHPRTYIPFVRRNGQPVIPGSSLKGAIRALAEALSASCLLFPGNPPPCPPVRPEAHSPHLCPACQLFGGVGYRGRILFEDAMPLKPVSLRLVLIGDLWQPRRSRGRKFYRNLAFHPAPEGAARNFHYVEAVPRGARFRTRIRVENTTSGEMGWLLRALGLEARAQELAPAFPIKIGGARPRCMGGVEIRPVELAIWDSARLSWRTEPIGTLGAWWHQPQWLREDAWDPLRRELRMRGDETCPRGPYRDLR